MLRKIITHYIFGLMVTLFFTSGCQKPRPAAKTEEAIPVKVERVVLSDLAQTIDYVGNVKAQDEAIIYPKASGKVIEKVKKDGDPVARAEAIAYLDRDEVGLKFEKAPVESSLSGVVGKVYVDIGENVTPQTPVALVVNMDTVKVGVAVPEKYLPRVSLGQEAKITVDAYPDKEFSGKVTKVSPVVDEATRSASLEISVDNAGHLLNPGMFARVKLIIAEHKRVPVIIKEAILGKEPELYVYIVENQKALTRKVILGIHQGPYYQVQEGLKEGERVVIMGQQRLYEGAAVTAEEEKQ